MDLTTFIQQALAEDIGDGDHTTLATISADSTGSARMILKENGIIAGIDLVLKVLKEIDPRLDVNVIEKDGDYAEKGKIVLTIEGSVHSILKSERLVLNIIQRMSGIATTTRNFVEKTRGTRAGILDTRKTTPGFRFFEKEAVRLGGGFNHRFGLFDMILIKDNHIDYAGGVENAIKSVQRYLSESGKKLQVEIEARSLEDVSNILKTGGVNRVMLDNFSPELLKKAVVMIKGAYETEASGGINLENIRQYAETGVDFISVGALTHSYKSLDISLKAIINH